MFSTPSWCKVSNNTNFIKIELKLTAESEILEMSDPVQLLNIGAQTWLLNKENLFVTLPMKANGKSYHIRKDNTGSREEGWGRGALIK